MRTKSSVYYKWRQLIETVNINNNTNWKADNGTIAAYSKLKKKLFHSQCGTFENLIR